MSTAPPVDYAAARGYMPPQPIKFFQNGHFMSTCEVTGERNMDTFLMEFTENCDNTEGISFLEKVMNINFGESLVLIDIFLV